MKPSICILLFLLAITSQTLAAPRRRFGSSGYAAGAAGGGSAQGLLMKRTPVADQINGLVGSRPAQGQTGVYPGLRNAQDSKNGAVDGNPAQPSTPQVIMPKLLPHSPSDSLSPKTSDNQAMTKNNPVPSDSLDTQPAATGGPVPNAPALTTLGWSTDTEIPRVANLPFPVTFKIDQPYSQDTSFSVSSSDIAFQQCTIVVKKGATTAVAMAWLSSEQLTSAKARMTVTMKLRQMIDHQPSAAGTAAAEQTFTLEVAAAQASIASRCAITSSAFKRMDSNYFLNYNGNGWHQAIKSELIDVQVRFQGSPKDVNKSFLTDIKVTLGGEGYAITATTDLSNMVVPLPRQGKKFGGFVNIQAEVESGSLILLSVNNQQPLLNISLNPYVDEKTKQCSLHPIILLEPDAMTKDLNGLCGPIIPAGDQPTASLPSSVSIPLVADVSLEEPDHLKPWKISDDLVIQEFHAQKGGHMCPLPENKPTPTDKQQQTNEAAHVNLLNISSSQLPKEDPTAKQATNSTLGQSNLDDDDVEDEATTGSSGIGDRQPNEVTNNLPKSENGDSASAAASGGAQSGAQSGASGSAHGGGNASAAKGLLVGSNSGKEVDNAGSASNLNDNMQQPDAVSPNSMQSNGAGIATATTGFSPISNQGFISGNGALKGNGDISRQFRISNSKGVQSEVFDRHLKVTGSKPSTGDGSPDAESSIVSPAGTYGKPHTTGDSVGMEGGIPHNRDRSNTRQSVDATLESNGQHNSATFASLSNYGASKSRLPATADNVDTAQTPDVESCLMSDAMKNECIELHHGTVLRCVVDIPVDQMEPHI